MHGDIPRAQLLGGDGTASPLMLGQGRAMPGQHQGPGWLADPSLGSTQGLSAGAC